jgi:hypothetical protein
MNRAAPAAFWISRSPFRKRTGIRSSRRVGLIRSFLISGLLLLTRSLDAGETWWRHRFRASDSALLNRARGNNAGRSEDHPGGACSAGAITMVQLMAFSDRGRVTRSRNIKSPIS